MTAHAQDIPHTAAATMQLLTELHNSDFRQKYSAGVQLLDSKSKYCMWVKLDSSFFCFKRDLYYGIIYLRYTDDSNIRALYFTEFDDDIVKYRSIDRWL